MSRTRADERGRSSPYSVEEDLFRETVRSFIDRELEPCYTELGTDSASRHAVWRRAGQAGILGVAIPEEHGGPGGTAVANVIISHELARSHCYATVGSLFCTDLSTGALMDGGAPELIATWAPRIMTGDAIQAMAISEPDAGSDVLSMRTTAERDGDSYVLRGAKTYITNGDIADLLYVVARTGNERRGRSLSMFAVTPDAVGVTRRKLATMGFPAGNTAELHFDAVRVPAAQRLGDEGAAMKIMMATVGYDRVQIAARALGQAELAFGLTLDYVKNRKAFGERVFDFQNTRFALAAMRTEIEAGRSFLHDTVGKVRAGQDGPADSAMVKLWMCEMSSRVLDGCVQLYGGMGYMDETPISRIYTSNRVLRIYAGTSEILKQSIARELEKGTS